MKVLKSGIEIDPKDLTKVKGGACACGCDIGVSSTSASNDGIEVKNCFCRCWEDPEALAGMATSASKYH